MTSRFVTRLAAVALMLGSATQASATLVTSIPGGTVHPMPALNYFGAGPQVFGSGITVTWSSSNGATQGGSVFGYTSTYGFGANGFWDGALGPMAGVNDSKDVYGVTDTMTFAFSTPQTAVGGFLNYFPGSLNPTTIAVYDASFNLIESTDLTFLTGGGVNTGQFLGFLENAPIISYFTLTDNYVGITNLTTLSTTVPEPGSLTLIGLGLAGVGVIGRRTRKPTATNL